MNRPNIFISVIVPVYNEENNIDQFLNRIKPILGKVSPDYEIIFSMDPSTDKTEEVISNHINKNSRIKLIKFSRRFGQPMATLAGIHHSEGEVVVVIDVDLQDPPELILKMIEKYNEGYEVIYAQRASRTGDKLLYKIIAKFWYKLMAKYSEVPIPPNTGDYRLISRRVVNKIKELKESHGFLRGMVAYVGFKTTSITFNRAPRLNGKGNYNPYFGSFRIGLNGLICYSNFLLNLSSTFGFFCAGMSFLIGITYIVMKFSGFPFPIGNPTIVCAILFLGGVQLISIGILGEYISRIYEEVKGRPKYIIDKMYGIEK